MSTLETDMRGWAEPDSEAVKKLAELIKDIRIAMLTTITSDGALRSRPMATQDPPFKDGEVWFFTADDSPKTGEIAKEHEVNLSYSEPKSQSYVSLSGTASLVRDQAKVRELWNPFVKAWFPKGPDDPHIALLRVRVHTAEFWDVKAGRMTSLFALAKSSLTGKAPTDMGEHEKIILGR